MEIKISAPKLGKQTGTVAYVLDYLASVELYINDTKRGNIGLFAKHKEDQKGEVVAIYAPNYDERIAMTYAHHGNGYFTPMAGETDRSYMNEEKTFFGPLTPAAWNLVENFLSQCVDVLKAAVQSDGESHTYSVTIVVP